MYLSSLTRRIYNASPIAFFSTPLQLQVCVGRLLAVVSLAVGEVREIWVLIAHKHSCLGKGWIATRGFSSLGCGVSGSPLGLVCQSTVPPADRDFVVVLW